MITDERLKQLMQQVGMPNSISLMQALRQCDMEATLDERERCANTCYNLWNLSHDQRARMYAAKCADAIRRQKEG